MPLIRLGCFFLISITFGFSQTYAADQPPNLTPLTTLYDYQLIDSQTKKVISLKTLVKQLADKEILFIGEFHGNPAVHLFQAQLQAALFQQNNQQVLSMEQFNRDQQAILNQYLDSEIGEKTLVKEAPAWQNYVASYRPLVEFAKQHLLPVIAANAPADVVRCVGRHGKSYLNKLAKDETTYLPKDPFYSDPAYQVQFQQFMQQGTSHSNPSKDKKANNSYFAQLLRDNSMAESILSAHQQHPNHQIIHLNGAFHSNRFLGTVSALKHRDSSLKIAVISPVAQNNPNQPSFNSADVTLGDYLLLVQPQPTDYVQASKRQAAFKAMFEKANAKPCR